MAILTNKDRQEVGGRLAEMENPVRLVFFTQQLADCQYCVPTEELLTEVCALSDKLMLEKYNIVTDSAVAQMYNIDKIPATAVVGENERDETVDYSIRFFGIPSGYEFLSLLDAILMVSEGDSGLSPESREALQKLTKPMHIQVFVTPSCPYCPPAVAMAHRLAFESQLIRSDMIEAGEFPALASRYAVQAVPKIVINGKESFQGALPEDEYIAKVIAAEEAEMQGQFHRE